MLNYHAKTVAIAENNNGGRNPKFDENSPAIMACAVAPKYAHDFLIGRKLTYTELFANCLPGAAKIDEYLPIPAGRQDPAIARPNESMSTRGQLAHSWRSAKKSYEESEKATAGDPAGTPVRPMSSRQRLHMSSEFQKRYNHTLAMGDTPSDRKLGTI